MKKTLKIILLTAFIMGCTVGASMAQVRFTQADKDVFNKVMEVLEPLKDEPMSVRIMAAAGAMIGTPYVAGTLEQEPEALTVSLAKTDCILLVEACACMAQTAGQKDRSFEAFCENLRQFRYRNGITDGYASRIHYSSEWIAQAQARGLLREVTGELSQTPLKQSFSYMSKNAGKYPVLVKNPGLVPEIAATEENLSGADYFYIPKSRLENSLDQIRHGDMICFVTNIEGLDITHVAYAYETYECEHDCCPDARGCSNGQRRLGFLHASSPAGKVVVDTQTLAGYVNSIKSCIGVRIVRF